MKKRDESAKNAALFITTSVFLGILFLIVIIILNLVIL